MIRIGPAGWSYKDWNGVVYPRPKPKGFDPLTYIAGHFDTIEVNTTFYRPAREHVAESWIERVGENERFRFTAKLWQQFTHQRKEPWTRDEVAQAQEAFDPLLASGRLGAVLLQFPWSFRRSDETREWLDDLATEFEDYPLVVEVRHETWNVPDFYTELIERGIGIVNIDQPQFSDSIGPSARATAATGYVRVHGRNYHDWWRKDAEPFRRYDYLYSAEELEPWVERTREVADSPSTADVYVVTNNHYCGKSVVNALMLASMLTASRVAAPAQLAAEYEEVLGPYVETRPGAGAEV